MRRTARPRLLGAPAPPDTGVLRRLLGAPAPPGAMRETLPRNAAMRHRLLAVPSLGGAGVVSPLVARRLRHRFLGVLALAGIALAAGEVRAQWFHHPEPDIPRLEDGSVDPDGPVPMLANGKPSLAGLWEHDNPLRYLFNIASDLDGDVPFQPWAREVFEQRMARRGADDPNNFCLPSGTVMKHAVPAPFKIIQDSGLLVLLYESRTIFRQIFTDGRPFPEDPQPAWYGYSVGHWEDDTLVVESMGYTDRFWLDTQGRPSTGQLRVTERFRRPGFGRLEVEITVDDPGAYTAPWTVRQTMHYLPDTDLIEHICQEDNRFPEQMGLEPAG